MQKIFISNLPYPLMDEIEIEHLRRVLDYIPCVKCEEITTEEERKYLCTICGRLNRIVSAEKAIPKWRIEGEDIIAVEGVEIEELKPTIKIIEEKEEEMKEEIEVLEIGEEIKEEEIQIEEELPEWNSIEEKIYTHGDYTLYTKEVFLRGGRKQRIYFFSKKKLDDATPSPLPEGYKVGVNKKTGLPFLKKK